MTGLLIVVPMLGRPHWVDPLLQSIDAATPDARVVFGLTPTDGDVIAAVAATGRDSFTVDHAPGDYARKVNIAIRDSREAHIFTGAGDLRFRPGWYEACLRELARRPEVGVVGTNDMCNRRTMRGEHATHMLVTRWYVERFGTVDEPGKFFHEGYEHEWCDDEAVETAKKRRAYAHALDAIVEHRHPMNGGNPMDPIYAAQGRRIAAGRGLYRERRRMWA